MKTYILMVFLLLASVTAADIHLVDSLLVDVTMDSSFELVPTGNPRIDHVQAEFQFYPVDSIQQEVVDASTSPQAELDGDTYLFYWDDPAMGTYHYSVRSQVRTHNRFAPLKDRVPFPVSIDDELLKYAEPTEKIDINQDIIERASMLAEGEDDLYIVVFKIAAWTNQNINYSLNTLTAEASQKASWVLENRYGVCDEMTNLFIAMLRSLDIPARFVSGLSYTDSELFDEEWGLHGWAEVYFPGHGWVAFDPTYGQYGYVDASHIKLRDSLDSDKSSTKFSWQSSNVDLRPGLLDTDVEILEKGDLQTIVSLDIDPLDEEVDFGSYNLIEVEVENQLPYYSGMELTLSAPQEVYIDEQVQYVYLRPFEEKSVYWIVQVDELKDGYIYTFPLSVLSSTGDEASDGFTSRKGAVHYSLSRVTNLLDQYTEQESKTYSKQVEIACSAPDIYIDELFTLDCTIKNTGNVYLKDVDVCLDDCTILDLGISQSEPFSFTYMINETGQHTIPISAENSQITVTELVSVFARDRPSLSIIHVEYPQSVSYGEEFSITFDIGKDSVSPAEDVRVVFDINGKSSDWNIEEVDANQAFEISLDKTVLAKENTFTIDIYYGEEHETYTGTFATENIGMWQKIEMWLNSVSRWLEAKL